MNKKHNKQALCKLCGEPMPEGEEVFYYHGYSCPCPKPPLKKQHNKETTWQHELKLLLEKVEKGERGSYLAVEQFFEAGAKAERDLIVKSLSENAEKFEKMMVKTTFGLAMHGMGNVHLFAQYLEEQLSHNKGD